MNVDAAHGTWVLDLDGVVWLSDQPIPGSAEAVGRLRAAGIRVVFATNNSSPTVGQLLERLSAAGVAAEPADLVTSAQAAASMLEPGDTAVVCAGAGVIEALAQRGVRVLEEGPANAVVVGWTREFDFDRLATAASAVRSGARLIGTNDDATYPTPSGLLPGGGAILAAVATASQSEPDVAGKPHAPLVSLIRERVKEISLVVGDRPSTDGRLAQRLSSRFGLVRSGVTSAGTGPMAVEPDEDASDLRSLVEIVLGSAL
ncbi:MAG: HAD-IIA family hydrolase [Acidimicrobiales bacterium]